MGRIIYLTMTKPQQFAVYDMLYSQAAMLLKRYNPCQHDSEGTCIAMREKAPGLEHGCCDGPVCKYLTPSGCGVESLSCKLWLCRHVRMKLENTEVALALDTLYHVGHQLLPRLGIRASKEEALDRSEV